MRQSREICAWHPSSRPLLLRLLLLHKCNALHFGSRMWLLLCAAEETTDLSPCALIKVPSRPFLVSFSRGTNDESPFIWNRSFCSCDSVEVVLLQLCRCCWLLGELVPVQVSYTLLWAHEERKRLYGDYLQMLSIIIFCCNSRRSKIPPRPFLFVCIANLNVTN